MNIFSDEEYVEIAERLIGHEQPEDALVFLNKAINLNPGNASAWLIKGNILLEQYQLNDALNCFNQCVALSGETAFAYYQRASAYIKFKNFEAAVNDLEKAISLYDVFHFDSHVLLAFCLLQLKYYEECDKVCDLVREYHFDNYSAFLYKYRCLERLERFDELITLAQKQIYADTEFADYHNALGYAYLLADELQKAVSCFDDALRCEPEHAFALNNKGRALFKIGYYDDAYKHFCQSIEYDRSNPLAYYNRALYYLNAGLADKARLDLLKARELNYREGFDSDVDDILLREFKISPTA